MINFRTIEYESEEKPNQVFSRLTWTTERVSIAGQLIFNKKVSTNRTWIGELNERDLTFALLEPRNSFISTTKFFQVVLRGRLLPSTRGTSIHISFRLSWFTLLFMCGIYIATIAMVTNIFHTTNSNELIGFVAWITIFPGLSTYLLIRKFNNLELEIERTLGVYELIKNDA